LNILSKNNNNIIHIAQVRTSHKCKLVLYILPELFYAFMEFVQLIKDSVGLLIGPFYYNWYIRMVNPRNFSAL